MHTIDIDASEELEFDQLPPGSQIDALLNSERQTRREKARHVRILGALACADWDCESEVSAALRQSAGTTQKQLKEARLLVTRFPEALDALARGEISWPQAQALAKITANMDTDAARAVQDQVLPRISNQVLSTTQAALRSAVTTVDPNGAARRHTRAYAERRVEYRAEDDGMATLSLYTGAETARAMLNAIDGHCADPADDDTRTTDQRRADTMAALVFSSLGVTTNATDQQPQIPALLIALVNLETLLETSDTPGELIGHGPITATQARALAAAPGTVYQRLIIAPDGTAVHADPTTYRPTASVARHVRATHPTCTFPGCRRQALGCDLDHIDNFDHEHPECGGQTTCANLHPVCRRHHNEKTNGRWHVQRIGHTIVWTSTITGISYISTPEPYPVARAGG